jgi:S-adenosylmethionine decarboxylase
MFVHPGLPWMSGLPVMSGPGGRARLAGGRTVSSHIMPGIDARSYAELRRDEARAPKMLYAVDAHCTPESPVTEAAALTELASAAVRAGGGHVLDASHVVFPNGAITLVLILAESHLSIHTWPEDNLIAIDLFSCGAINGQLVLDELIASLHLTQVTVRNVERGLPASPVG